MAQNVRIFINHYVDEFFTVVVMIYNPGIWSWYIILEERLTSLFMA